MKNARRKAMRVILCCDGKPTSAEVFQVGPEHQGRLGFRVPGRVSTVWWSDEGKTWKRMEDSK